MGLLSELKRRNVFRMAALYMVAAWLIMQVAEVLLALASLPVWTGQAVLIILAIGFPVALLFSWFYELTPAGLSLEKDVEPGKSITHITGRSMDFIVIALLSAALIVFAFDKWWIGPPPGNSVAVLAFENMSDDPAQEYFSDGLSDTLIHVLSQVSGLKVAAKPSSFYFKDRDIMVGDIARELGVATVLEGSVQKSGDRVRIIAQLVNAEDGTRLWSQSFDRDLQDLFAVQDEIAREVVTALKVTLLDTEIRRLAQRYQPSLEAYEQLVLGRYEMARQTADGLAAAEQHFKRAIESDSGYSLAYVYLADTYGLEVTRGGLVFEEALRQRQELVEKALELDPLSGEAHAAKAFFEGHQRMQTGEVYDPTIQEEELLKAIELSPNYATAYQLYGSFLAEHGRLDEGLAQVRIAAELDPMSPIIMQNLALATWNAGRVEEALTLLRANIERTPEFPANYDAMAGLQMRLGHLGEAQRWNREARRRNSESAYTWLAECIGFLNLGDLPSADDCVRQLLLAHPEKVVSSYGARLIIYAYRGDATSVIGTLEEGLTRVRGFLAFHRWLASWLAGQGDVERARHIMAEAFPALLEDDPAVSVVDPHSPVVFAAILRANGETGQADALLFAAEEQIASMHRIRGVGYGILDVHIHAIRGDRDKAIASLREAIDAGWRAPAWAPLNSAWWTLRRDWILANLHDDPEFIALIDELEADVRRQRRWYEAHKDDPLF